MSGRYDKVSGIWQPVSDRRDKVNGVWSPVNARYDKVSGIWTPSFQGYDAIAPSGQGISADGSINLNWSIRGVPGPYHLYNPMFYLQPQIPIASAQNQTIGSINVSSVHCDFTNVGVYLSIFASENNFANSNQLGEAGMGAAGVKNIFNPNWGCYGTFSKVWLAIEIYFGSDFTSESYADFTLSVPPGGLTFNGKQYKKIKLV